MRFFKRILCIALSVLLLLQVLAGCSSKKTNEDLYLTKGEFFAYIVYQTNMTSNKYSIEDIQKCEDGSVQGEILAEWKYLSKEQATKKIKSHVTKEIVITVCANAAIALEKGNISDIKDADLLDNPQLIADAYASGLFELDNGYFDGSEKMSYAQCKETWEKTKKLISDFNYEKNTELTETADGVIEQDASGYQEGDIIIDFSSENSVGSQTNENLVVPQSSNSTSSKIKAMPLTLTTVNSATSVIQLSDERSDDSVVSVCPVDVFTATIRKPIFEGKLGNPKPGSTVVFHQFDDATLDKFLKPTNPGGQIVGVLVSAQLFYDGYHCIFEYPEFETAVKEKNVTEANYSQIKSPKLEKSNVAGWNIKFEPTSTGLNFVAEKTFTQKGEGEPQEWQNSQKSVNAKATFSINNFRCNVDNLASFATKSGKGWIKVQYDSDFSIDLSSDLKYTPDSNRNGKFPSNFRNSRWTDQDAPGADKIKVARFLVSLDGGITSIEVYVYLQVTVDGHINWSTSINGGGIMIETDEGKILKHDLGEKTEKLDAEANIKTRFGAEVSVKIFGFISVIGYDIGGYFNVHIMASLYHKEEMLDNSVYAPEKDLLYGINKDTECGYCYEVIHTVGISGWLMDSGVKIILDAFNAGTILDFDIELVSWGFHKEDGQKVPECTRGSNLTDEIEKSKNDEVMLGQYKVVLDVGESETVWIQSLPKETIDLLEVDNTITVESNNDKICEVYYNKANKSIIIEGIGNGSTEIVIRAEKGWWIFSHTVEQNISVTVNGHSEVIEYDNNNFVA